MSVLMLKKGNKNLKESSSLKLKTAFIILTIVNFYFATWNIRRGSLYFHTDIARDFLLIQDLVQKKLVLIGERAGVYGVFHGPLWLYLNLPAFILGKGNPVFVGWFWVLLAAVSTYLVYRIGKHLFSQTVGLIFALLFSSQFITTLSQFSHPNGAYIVMPFAFFSLWKYLETKKILFLAIHVILAGLIIQFEIAPGIPFLILSFIYVFFNNLKQRNLKHLLAYLLIIIPLSTFILFDLRHDFFMLKNFISYLGEDQQAALPLRLFIENRIDYFLVLGVPLIISGGLTNKLIALLTLAFPLLLIKENINRKFYLTSYYFIFGFFILTSMNRGGLQGHQFLPFVPIVFLVFASLYKTRFKEIILVLLFLITASNLAASLKFINESKKYIQNDISSWIQLKNVADWTVNQPENDFGYFVYAPDAYAHQMKYAMSYAVKNQKEKNITYFKKKNIIFVIAEPPPPLEPWITSDWWIKEKIGIKSNPTEVKEFPNRYQVKKYLLNTEELQILPDPNADIGITFR